MFFILFFVCIYSYSLAPSNRIEKLKALYNQDKSIEKKWAFFLEELSVSQQVAHVKLIEQVKHFYFSQKEQGQGELKYSSFLCILADLTIHKKNSLDFNQLCCFICILLEQKKWLSSEEYYLLMRQKNVQILDIISKKKVRIDTEVDMRWIQQSIIYWHKKQAVVDKGSCHLLTAMISLLSDETFSTFYVRIIKEIERLKLYDCDVDRVNHRSIVKIIFHEMYRGEGKGIINQEKKSQIIELEKKIARALFEQRLQKGEVDFKCLYCVVYVEKTNEYDLVDSENEKEGKDLEQISRELEDIFERLIQISQERKLVYRSIDETDSLVYLWYQLLGEKSESLPYDHPLVDKMLQQGLFVESDIERLVYVGRTEKLLQVPMPLFWNLKEEISRQVVVQTLLESDIQGEIIEATIVKLITDSMKQKDSFMRSTLEDEKQFGSYLKAAILRDREPVVIKIVSLNTCFRNAEVLKSLVEYWAKKLLQRNDEKLRDIFKQVLQRQRVIWDTKIGAILIKSELLSSFVISSLTTIRCRRWLESILCELESPSGQEDLTIEQLESLVKLIFQYSPDLSWNETMIQKVVKYRKKEWIEQALFLVEGVKEATYLKDLIQAYIQSPEVVSLTLMNHFLSNNKDLILPVLYLCIVEDEEPLIKMCLSHFVSWREKDKDKCVEKVIQLLIENDKENQVMNQVSYLFDIFKQNNLLTTCFQKTFFLVFLCHIDKAIKEVNQSDEALDSSEVEDLATLLLNRIKGSDEKNIKEYCSLFSLLIQKVECSPNLKEKIFFKWGVSYLEGLNKTNNQAIVSYYKSWLRDYYQKCWKNTQLYYQLLELIEKSEKESQSVIRESGEESFHSQLSDYPDLERFVNRAIQSIRGGIISKQFKSIGPIELPEEVKLKVRQIAQNFLKTVQSSDTNKKILIVGGGPVGMVTALLCYQFGHKVSVFEKRENFTRIQRLTLTDKVIKSFEKYLFILEQGSFFEFLVSQKEVNYARISTGRKVINIPISTLEEILYHLIQVVNELTESQNQVIHYYKKCSFLNYTYNQVENQFNNLMFNDRSGRSFFLKSDILIGCDGARSKVREVANRDSKLYLNELTGEVDYYQYFIYTKGEGVHPFLSGYKWSQGNSEDLTETQKRRLHQDRWNQDILKEVRKEDMYVVSFYNKPYCICYISSLDEREKVNRTGLKVELGLRKKEPIKNNEIPVFLIGDSLCHGFLGKSFNNAMNYLFMEREALKKMLSVPNQSSEFVSEVKSLRKSIERKTLEYLFKIQMSA